MFPKAHTSRYCNYGMNATIKTGEIRTPGIIRIYYFSTNVRVSCANRHFRLNVHESTSGVQNLFLLSQDPSDIISVNYVIVFFTKNNDDNYKISKYIIAIVNLIFFSIITLHNVSFFFFFSFFFRQCDCHNLGLFFSLFFPLATRVCVDAARSRPEFRASVLPLLSTRSSRSFSSSCGNGEEILGGRRDSSIIESCVKNA